MILARQWPAAVRQHQPVGGGRHVPYFSARLRITAATSAISLAVCVRQPEGAGGGGHYADAATVFTEQAPERLQAIAELYDPLMFSPSRRVGDFFCRVRKQAAADGVPYFAAGVESCCGAGIAADSDRHPFRQSRLQLLHAIRLTPGSLSDKQSEAALAQDLADALHASGNAVSLS